MSDLSSLPGWAILLIVVPPGLLVLALLGMPFAVFGLKPRLRDLEFQIEALRREIHALHGMPPDATPRPRVMDETRPGPSESFPPGAPGAFPPESAPPASVLPGGPSYEDDPFAAPPRPRSQAQTQTEWPRAPWEQDAQRGASEGRAQPREGLAPRGRAPDEDADSSRPRAEPRLRWPPRA